MKIKNDKSVLVVAFDGLDYELIKKFGLTNITQNEFGKIDNYTGVNERKTSELFTSFITGETYKQHRVTDIKVWNKNRAKYLDNVFSYFPIIGELPEFRRNVLESIRRFDFKKRAVNRNDYEIDTLFDKIENSKALNVPGYNPSPFWSRFRFGITLNKYDLEEKPLYKYWDEHEFDRRKKQLFRPVNTYYDFVMAHFHRVDMHQHVYRDEKSLKKLYQETDDFAGEILDYFEDEFDVIIFMSDHGLPKDNQHNKEAFYSCNTDLFSCSKVHITDFYDVILGEKSETEVAVEKVFRQVGEHPSVEGGV